MAEIEHFCDPNEKSHPKFDSVKDTVMLLYSACNQMDGKSAAPVKIGDAVKTVSHSSSVTYHHSLLSADINERRVN